MNLVIVKFPNKFKHTFFLVWRNLESIDLLLLFLLISIYKCLNIFIPTDINECASLPCQNNGTCIDLINEYKCSCTNGYSGMNCTNDTCKYNIILYSKIFQYFKILKKENGSKGNLVLTKTMVFFVVISVKNRLAVSEAIQRLILTI